MGVCNCSMFCFTLLYVHSSIAIILMGKRELIALLNLSSWCLVMVGRLFLAVPRGCLQFVNLFVYSRGRGFTSNQGTVLPAKRDIDVMFCLQRNQGLIIDRLLVY